MEFSHMEALAIIAGLNRLSDAIKSDDSTVADTMREAIAGARGKIIDDRNIDVEWRK